MGRRGEGYKPKPVSLGLLAASCQLPLNRSGPQSGILSKCLVVGLRGDRTLKGLIDQLTHIGTGTHLLGFGDPIKQSCSSWIQKQLQVAFLPVIHESEG